MGKSEGRLRLRVFLLVLISRICDILQEANALSVTEVILGSLERTKEALKYVRSTEIAGAKRAMA